DLMTDRAAVGFVGRERKVTLLLGILDANAPPIWHVHGIPGIGKSSLLDAFAAAARERGAAVVRVDCRMVEPTSRAFLRALGAEVDGEIATADAAADGLGRLGERVVLILDTYEVFRLLDTWLRQVFVPALPVHVRVVTAGREKPAPAWTIEPGWAGLVRDVPLGPLPGDAAVAMLVRAGITPEAARRIDHRTRGHPLALRLAAGAATSDPDAVLETAALPQVVAALTHLYLADIGDPLTRAALEAAAVVRRTTRPLLAATLGANAAQDALDRLRALPFVEQGRDGLILHEAVQTTIAASLAAADPVRYRDLRRTAWRHLRTSGAGLGPADLWRFTADMLFLIENPDIREGFFPTDAHRFTVASAQPADGPAIQAISALHDPPAATAALAAWWARAPQTFWVVRDPAGAVAGFSVVFVADDHSPEVTRADPLLRGWLSHLRRDPVVRGQRVLFSPRWLSRDDGEAASPVQGVLWLEIKRLYMELRPHLRRVYVAQHDLTAHAAAMQRLGFRRLPDADVDFDGTRFQTLMLDFGPASVDGWLTGLVAAELGVGEGDILDVAARELVLDERRIGLTPLEFAVMHYLTEREGAAVSRADLLADVWGHDYDGGSNVVDVVVGSLRKKLGERAALIEAVRGTGYRLRAG
ncbi:MAG TPA: winged helix-turn-helix domain-containing protein, partial [Thermomicrobiales bacterium]|nr:winged helix-turn-helix domain-containing protein [Thermomicrobiales bacterium]